MMEGVDIFEIGKVVLFWLSPCFFLIGVFLILYSNYRALEEKFGEEIGGLRHRTWVALETNIYTLHEWLMARRTLLGVICIVLAIVIFFVVRR